jgi:hypothetical protein
MEGPQARVGPDQGGRGSLVVWFWDPTTCRVPDAGCLPRLGHAEVQVAEIAAAAATAATSAVTGKLGVGALPCCCDVHLDAAMLLACLRLVCVRPREPLASRSRLAQTAVASMQRRWGVCDRRKRGSRALHCTRANHRE